MMPTPQQLRTAMEQKAPAGYPAYTSKQLTDLAITEDSFLGQKIQRAMKLGVSGRQALNFYAYGDTQATAKSVQLPKKSFFDQFVEETITGPDGVVGNVGRIGMGAVEGVKNAKTSYQEVREDPELNPVASTIGEMGAMGSAGTNAAYEPFRPIVESLVNAFNFLNSDEMKAKFPRSPEAEARSQETMQKNNEMKQQIAAQIKQFSDEHPNVAASVKGAAQIAELAGTVVSLKPTLDLGENAVIGIGKTGVQGAQTGKGLYESAVAPLKTRAAQRASEELDDVVGKILQGKAEDIPQGRQAFSSVDLKGVKTYQDIDDVMSGRIEAIAGKQNTILDQYQSKVLLKDMTKISKAGSQTVKMNPVKDAMDNLEELYTVTRQPEQLARIRNMRDVAVSEGLTTRQINDLAREYGEEFGQKAFTPLGEPRTSVNAIGYENTRKAVKETSRALMPDSAAQFLDDEMSALLNTRTLIRKMSERAQKLSQRVVQRGLVARFSRQLGRAIDLATLRGPSSFAKSFIPGGFGKEMMSSLDIQDALAANLKKFDRLLAKMERGVWSDTEAVKAISESGLFNAASPDLAKIPGAVASSVDDIAAPAATSQFSEVPLSKIKPPKAIEKDFATKFQSTRPPAMDNLPIDVMKEGDSFRIVDGVHRLAAAMKRGDKTIRINVIE